MNRVIPTAVATLMVTGNLWGACTDVPANLVPYCGFDSSLEFATYWSVTDGAAGYWHPSNGGVAVLIDTAWPGGFNAGLRSSSFDVVPASQYLTSIDVHNFEYSITYCQIFIEYLDAQGEYLSRSNGGIEYSLDPLSTVTISGSVITLPYRGIFVAEFVVSCRRDDDLGNLSFEVDNAITTPAVIFKDGFETGGTSRWSG